MGVTGSDDAFSPAHAAEGGGGFKAQFPGLGHNQISNLVAFKVAPHIFHWIEFWRIGGEPLNLDATTGGHDIVPDQPTAVNRSPIPDHQYFFLEYAVADAAEIR